MIVDDLKLIERGGAQARNGFRPAGAAVFGGEHYAVESGGGGVKIARDEEARSERIDGGDFEEHGTRLLVGAGETEGIDVGLRTSVIDMHRRLSEKGSEEEQREAGLHEIPTVQRFFGPILAAEDYNEGRCPGHPFPLRLKVSAGVRFRFIRRL